MAPATVTIITKITVFLGKQVAKKIEKFLLAWFDDVKVGLWFNKLTEDQQIRFITSLRNNVPLIDEKLLGKYAHVLKEFKEMPEVDDIDRMLNTLRNIHKDELRLIWIIWINKICKFGDGITFNKRFLNQFDINWDSWVVLQNEGLISTTSVASFSPTTNFYITAKYLKVVSVLNIDDNEYLERAISENYVDDPALLKTYADLEGALGEIFMMTQDKMKGMLRTNNIEGIGVLLRQILNVMEDKLESAEKISIERMMDPSKYREFIGIECIALMKKNLGKLIHEYFDRYDQEIKISDKSIKDRIEKIIKRFHIYYNEFHDFLDSKKRMINRNEYWYLFLFDNINTYLKSEENK